MNPDVLCVVEHVDADVLNRFEAPQTDSGFVNNRIISLQFLTRKKKSKSFY